MTYKNANEAFERLYNRILINGEETANTKRLLNQGFYIKDPLDNAITADFRGWSKSYAEAEWKWYLSENRDVRDLAKRAPIWNNMHDGSGIVNSNYGYQWMRNRQLFNAIDELKKNPNSRRAYVTIHDGKEYDQYSLDTPCTLSIGFYINNGLLHMNVMMRSNDLWFGFCNDQYCFSKLQKSVSNILDIPVGSYYHFANDLHIYKQNII